jgi:hypothetical protein
MLSIGAARPFDKTCGRFRAECLNARWFLSLDDARSKNAAFGSNSHQTLRSTQPIVPRRQRITLARACIWALAGFSYWRALKENSLRWWILLALALAGAFWCKYFAIVLAIPLVLFLFIDRDARARLRK